MEALESCSRLKTLNGFEKFKEIVSGGITSIDADGKELAFSICSYLPKSAATLTSLSLRLAPIINFIYNIAVDD